MPRKKLQRISELKNFNNVAENNQAQGQQKLKAFLAKNTNIILELGCGKGEYALALAQKYKQKKIIGVDIQGERLFIGAKLAQENKITNVFFLREQIENLENYFSPNSVSQIWITFPDPRPKKGEAKKRLTSPRFLQIYKNILKRQGKIHLKTDDDNFFAYSQESIIDFGGKIQKQINDIYKNPVNDELLKIPTYYEKMHRQNGKSIHYLEFSLK